MLFSVNEPTSAPLINIYAMGEALPHQFLFGFHSFDIAAQLTAIDIELFGKIDASYVFFFFFGENTSVGRG